MNIPNPKRLLTIICNLLIVLHKDNIRSDVLPTARAREEQ
jgi:hypothetical protein